MIQFVPQAEESMLSLEQPFGSVDRFQGIRELGLGKNYKFIFNNLSLSIGMKVIYGL
jgi:hypothetical protein